MSDDLLEPTEGEDQINLDDLDVKRVLGEDEDDDDHTPLSSEITANVKDDMKELDNYDDDLFDAAIEPTSVDEKPVVSKSNEAFIGKESTPQPSLASTLNTGITSNGNKATALNASGKKYCCYVSNMTWWTTDADLQSMIQACDVDDIVDIRFYENRQNGQSKGFALVVLGSENSVKSLMEKLPQKPINGQSVQVHGYSKANLAKLEESSRKNDTRQRSQSETTAGTVRIDGSGSATQPAPSGAAAIPGLVGMIRAANTNSQPAPQFSQPPPTIRPPNLLQPPPQQQLPNFMTRPPPVQLAPAQPMMNRPPPGFPQQTPLMSAPPPMLSNQAVMGMNMQMSGMHNGGFPMNQPTPFGMHQFSGPPPQMDMEQPLSSHDFEEIMSRNHIVSSSAISRAVSDAAAGEYRSAIETLVTAVNLIKQSRIYNHDRCKALISSLEDTIRGIESKHYSRKHRRSRSRSPERSRKHRRRSRSRSRDRYSPRRSRY